MHESIQKAWPIDTEAVYGPLPVPLRMHASPYYQGEGVTLAMVDSDFYPHPDLVEPRNRIRAWVDASADPIDVHFFEPDDRPQWPGWDAQSPVQWHGLMTSVVAAGDGGLSDGLYRGLASKANVVLMKVSNARGRITDASIERALRWLLANTERLRLRVVNISVTGDLAAESDDPIDRAASALVRRGVVVVAASGNDGVRKLLPPATCPDAITVGGLDEQNSLELSRRTIWHSNYGESTIGALKPELVAPSIWVVAPILPGTDQQEDAANLFERRALEVEGIEQEIAEKNFVSPHYKLVEGTSFAAPIVASTVACMLEANPLLTPDLVRYCLAKACTPVEGASAEQQGLGALDSGQAVAHALRAKGGVMEGYAASPYVTKNGIAFLLHHKEAERVEIFGTWNNWTRGILARPIHPGVWRAVAPVFSPGRYVYKFLIDGRWIDDPSNPRKVRDGHGGFNSILVISNPR